MLTRLGQLLIYAGLLVAAAGALTSSKEIVGGAVILAGFGYFARDYGDKSLEVLSPMSVYMLAASVWFGLANLVAYWAYDTRMHFLFVDWRVDEYFAQAQLVGAVGGVFAPMLGFAGAVKCRHLGLRPWPIGFNVSRRTLMLFGWGFLALTWGVRLTGFRPYGLGMVHALIVGGADFAIFLFTMHLHSVARSHRFAWGALISLVVILEAVYQLAYSNLRTDAMLPFVAVLIPYLVEKRVTLRVAAVAGAVSVAFILLLEPFAAARLERITGSERLNRLFAETQPDAERIQIGVLSLFSRLSTCSQLSQICRLVNEDGHLGGETMSYVAYAFIPRAVWPTKPRVAPGQWFAAKLGRGRALADGTFSNAINMTIPGEFFLNFGWIGILAGGAIYGLLLGLGWDAARVGRACRNPIGLVFAFIIFAQVSGTGAHVGYVLNVVFWYLLLLGVSMMCHWVMGHRRAHRVEAPADSVWNAPLSMSGPRNGR